jgi:hypothetical protein
VSLTRRLLAKQVCGALFAAIAARGGAARLGHTAGPRRTPARAPVVSFFLDQPYLDMSGLGVPYLPPEGLRGGEPLASLSEEQLRSIFPHG